MRQLDTVLALHADTERMREVVTECDCGQLPALPLSERAPEVTQLLAQIRAQEAGNDGGWPGGDTVSILCEWFTANGYDIDAPLCPDCGPDRYGRHGVGHACGEEPAS